jgi:predicted nucleic acid-binding protein
MGLTRRATRLIGMKQMQDRVFYYDSLIVASAQEAGCKVLFSEDLIDGQIIGEVKIINIYQHPEMF